MSVSLKKKAPELLFRSEHRGFSLLPAGDARQFFFNGVKMVWRAVMA